MLDLHPIEALVRIWMTQTLKKSLEVFAVETLTHSCLMASPKTFRVSDESIELSTFVVAICLRSDDKRCVLRLQDEEDYAKREQVDFLGF